MTITCEVGSLMQVLNALDTTFFSQPLLNGVLRMIGDAGFVCWRFENVFCSESYLPILPAQKQWTRTISRIVETLLFRNTLICVIVLHHIDQPFDLITSDPSLSNGDISVQGLFDNMKAPY